MTKFVFSNMVDWPKDAYISPHRHNCYEIVYYVESSGLSIINDQKVKFFPKKYCIIPKNFYHDEKHFSAGRTMFVGFETDDLNIDEPILLDDDINSTIEHLIKRIINETNHKLYNYRKYRDVLLDEVLIHVNRTINNIKQNEIDFSYITSYINENYGKKIEIDQLINSTNYSKSHFRRLFKNKYGISIHKYLIEVRLNKARSLLKNSNINCTNIASICGFSDNFSFSKLFKIKYGISPKQFQLQSRQNQ